MSKPQVTFSDDLYRFAWGDEQVSITLERFNERAEDIACEAVVMSSHPTLGGQLCRGRLLLIGPRSRADIRKQCAERQPDVDWGSLLEQTCSIALDRYRRGEPVVTLADVQLGETPRFLLRPLIDQHGTTILFGDGGVSKSVHALAIGASIASGIPILGYAPAYTCPVLYLDWEADAETHAERLAAICAPQAIEVPRSLYYKRCVSSFAEAARDIRRDIAEKGIGFWIVDSAGAACGADPEKAEAVVRLMNAGRSLGVPGLMIHHITKDQRDKTKPFGSVYAHNLARLTWRLDKKQDAGDDRMVVAFTNYKANYGRLERQIGLSVAFTNAADGRLQEINFAATDVMDEPELAKASLRVKIIRLMKDNGGHPIPVAEIALMLGAGTETVRTTLKRSADWFQNVGERGWGLTETAREVEPDKSW